MKRHVAILVFDDVEVLDFAGPFEVFALADELHDHTAFHTFTLALKPGTVRARNGLKIVPDFTLENCPSPQVLVIPGGAGTRPLLQMPSLLEWLRVKSRKIELLMSVCTGALVLARAGLLDGLRATTHHAFCTMDHPQANRVVFTDTLTGAVTILDFSSNGLVWIQE